MEECCETIGIVRRVPRTSFNPPPKVDSIVLKFIVKKNRNFSQEQRLIELWKRAFTHPRKTIVSNIKGSVYNTELFRKKLLELGYDERVRAEAMKREDWKHFL